MSFFVVPSFSADKPFTQNCGTIVFGYVDSPHHEFLTKTISEISKQKGCEVLVAVSVLPTLENGLIDLKKINSWIHRFPRGASIQWIQNGHCTDFDGRGLENEVVIAGERLPTFDLFSALSKGYRYTFESSVCHPQMNRAMVEWDSQFSTVGKAKPFLCGFTAVAEDDLHCPTAPEKEGSSVLPSAWLKLDRSEKPISIESLASEGKLFLRSRLAMYHGGRSMIEGSQKTSEALTELFLKEPSTYCFQGAIRILELTDPQKEVLDTPSFLLNAGGALDVLYFNKALGYVSFATESCAGSTQKSLRKIDHDALMDHRAAIENFSTFLRILKKRKDLKQSEFKEIELLKQKLAQFNSKPPKLPPTANLDQAEAAWSKKLKAWNEKPHRYNEGDPDESAFLSMRFPHLADDWLAYQGRLLALSAEVKEFYFDFLAARFCSAEEKKKLFSLKKELQACESRTLAQ